MQKFDHVLTGGKGVSVKGLDPLLSHFVTELEICYDKCVTVSNGSYSPVQEPT